MFNSYDQYFRFYLLLLGKGWKVFEFILPEGAELNISSIFTCTSPVNLGSTSRDLMVSSSWAGRVTPVIAEETSGLDMTQAIASWAIEQSSSLARASNCFRAAMVSSFLGPWKYPWKYFIVSGFSARRLPSGIPLLYFPVRVPPASGEKTVVPRSLA